MGYLGQGEPEGLLVEAVGAGGIVGDLDHPVPVGVEGPAALGVVPGQHPGLVAAVPSGTGGSPD